MQRISRFCPSNIPTRRRKGQEETQQRKCHGDFWDVWQDNGVTVRFPFI